MGVAQEADRWYLKPGQASVSPGPTQVRASLGVAFDEATAALSEEDGRLARRGRRKVRTGIAMI